MAETAASRGPADRDFIPSSHVKIRLLAVEPKLGQVMGMQVPPPPPPPPAPPGRPEELPEEPELPGRVVAGIVASDRIAFLSKIEGLLALDRKVRELEEENSHLIHIVARLQCELDEARRK